MGKVKPSKFYTFQDGNVIALKHVVMVVNGLIGESFSIYSTAGHVFRSLNPEIPFGCTTTTERLELLRRLEEI